MSRKQATTYWHVLVPQNLNKAVEDSVLKGEFSTKSEVIRDSVRKRIQEIK